MEFGQPSPLVMAGFMPAIHVFKAAAAHIFKLPIRPGRAAAEAPINALN